MHINWKLRFQNRITLTAVVVQVVALVYAVLGMWGIVPTIGESALLEIAYMLIELLCLLGIVVDPTTAGVSDSHQALAYEKPRE